MAMTKVPLVFGAIADDLTGALELASMLVARGVETTLSVGTETPSSFGAAHVIALKSRVAPIEEAVASVLAALDVLQERGVRQVFFKYCATFDSTAQGNIGPSAEALLERLDASHALFVPALCETQRTVYLGHMFGGRQLLGESPKRFDPLTPMTDSNLVRVLQAQSRGKVGLIEHTIVAGGPDAVRSYCERETKEAGTSLFLADTLSEQQLGILAAAAVDMPLLTGNSSVAAHLPPLWFERGLAEPRANVDLPGIDGPGAVLVGSLAAQSAEQLARFSHSGDVLDVDVSRAYTGHDVVAEAARFAAGAIASGRDFAVNTAMPQVLVDRLQTEHGRLHVAGQAERILSAIARIVVQDLGVRRLVVAGGETSGAIVRALDVKELEVGPYREPGFSRAVAHAPHEIAIMLKSGKLGGPDIFASALDDMRRAIAEPPLLEQWPPKG
ncbi:membrane protein [Aquamicrobium defluvii]|uniref:3-oxo-tetronate kinase n=2 Tax=Aquamicrobium defluvii TaxID=69279 RepID=A0A011TFZ0_9HYPH|nr:membrane protein [Aquamicrobium defluvii]EZQ17715.1 membrane protein [Halopseudomonas bauzanensis]